MLNMSVGSANHHTFNKKVLRLDIPVLSLTTLFSIDTNPRKPPTKGQLPRFTLCP